MKLHLQTNRRGNLVARQIGGRGLRCLIGIPLFVFGLLMFLGTLSTIKIAFTKSGWGVIEALSPTVATLLAAGISLPLGWWILVAQRWIVMDAEAGEILEISEWKLGRKVKRTPLTRFCSVRIALELLNPSSKSSRHGTYVQQIRLIPQDVSEQPSIEIGWVDEHAREEGIQIASRVGDKLKLPVEIADEDRILISPEREQEGMTDDESRMPG